MARVSRVTDPPFAELIGPRHGTDRAAPADGLLSRALIDASLDCVIAVDADARVIEWNAAAERTFGHSRERALGADVATLTVPAEGRERYRRQLIEMAVNPKMPTVGKRLERVGLRADGEEFPIELTVARIEGAEPIAVGFVRDITEQKRAAEQRYRGLIERLPMVSYLAECGADGRWLYVSPQIEELLGYSVEEWLADENLWWERIHPEDRERVQADEDACAATLEPSVAEYRMFARDGHMVWVRDESSYGREGEDGRVLVEGVMLDITDRCLAEEELRHAVDHDELTGLANRRRFAEELRRRRSNGARGAVAVLDLDDLKYVNDSLGHAAGDNLLRSVSAALTDALRPGEFLARFGGDEFTILFEGSMEKAVRRRIAALLRALRSRDARASVGAVLFDGQSVATDEDLLIAADIAMRAAKERGGDRYEVFTGSGTERLAWVGHLREAIDADRLTLHHQPIFDLGDGTPAADEILVRMLEPDGSVLSPAAFLPTAERFGLIREIDRWVIAHAIEAAAHGGPITINVSARSISDPQLPHHIAAALKRSGADPANVVFEITETAAASAREELRAFGARIERLGCALAIDDFGTGFGSLTYLKHLPVRYLKIDMEFVRGITESAADRAIVQSIVTIAKSLNMQTIGEGVEDEPTLALLTELGVDYAQGYHLGRPAALA